MKNPNTKKPAHECTLCGQGYRKQDFNFCPFCGGDGGGIMAKGWKPSKREKKAFMKKNNFKNN